ncbi:MAG TPA: CoA transferase [Candidatus Binataceae bacterium]|nr:CoA transferase [Candidatus Binataceae bacterium]
MSAETQRHVLDGYKVLDFTQFVAGPTVTLMMAEMGAEVIKIEAAPAGDPTRIWPVMKEGRSGYFVQHNRGKQSLCLDAKSAEGAAILKELVSKVDVIVENFAPGVIARLGLGYEAVSKINPRVVMCSVSAFGQTGPLAHEPGFDWCGAAYGGILYMIGMPDGQPIAPTTAIGDVSTGVHALSAIACALLYRERTGKGQYLDCALLDTYFNYHEASVQLQSLSGGGIRPKRTGSHATYTAPAGIFRGREKYFIIFAQMDHMWAKLCALMGRPELAADPRFADNTGRVKNLGDIVTIIEGWIRSMPSDDAAMAALRESRIPMAPILSLEEAMAHPHLRQRGTVRRVRDRTLGEFDLPGFPLRFSAFPGTLELQAPTLGEHNAAVLGRYLGYTPERVGALEAQGVLRRGSH